MAKLPKILVLERIFDVANRVAVQTIKAVRIPAGSKCEFFYPQEPPPSDVARVFDNDSQRFIYSTVPNKTDINVVLGIFGDTYKDSDQTFDNYNAEDPYILTDGVNKIPVNTKVKVYRKKNLFIFKVQKHFVYPSTGKGQIYYKNMLVPWN
jgi:hypothetical protein